jgi:hypothetical protein
MGEIRNYNKTFLFGKPEVKRSEDITWLTWTWRVEYKYVDFKDTYKMRGYGLDSAGLG